MILIEFKKSNEFLSSDKKQVEDYATNLKYFHKDSDGRLIIPILFASNAEKRENTYDVNENIAKTLMLMEKTNEIISEALVKFKNDHL